MLRRRTAERVAQFRERRRGVHRTGLELGTLRGDELPDTCEQLVEHGSLPTEPALQLEDRVDRAGIDVVVEREIARDPVADVHEVEELREATFALRLDAQTPGAQLPR